MGECFSRCFVLKIEFQCTLCNTQSSSEQPSIHNQERSTFICVYINIGKYFHYLYSVEIFMNIFLGNLFAFKLLLAQMYAPLKTSKASRSQKAKQSSSEENHRKWVATLLILSPNFAIMIKRWSSNHGIS